MYILGRLTHLYCLVIIRLHVSAPVGHHQVIRITSLITFVYMPYEISSVYIGVIVKIYVTKILYLKLCFLSKISYVKSLVIYRYIRFYYSVYYNLCLFQLSCIGLICIFVIRLV
jgi:hypothetical protein